MERRIIFQKRNKQTNKQKEQQQKLHQSLSYRMIEAEIPQGVILYLLLK